MRTYRGNRPSYRTEERHKEPSKRSNGRYPFSKKIYRLQYADQIGLLFDEVPNENSNKYYGKISGIEAGIDFSSTSSCKINAKTEEDLDKVYKEVIKSLIRR